MKKNKTNATRQDNHHNHYMRHETYRSQIKLNESTCYDNGGYKPRPSKSLEEILHNAFKMFSKKHPDQINDLHASFTTYKPKNKN